MSASYQQQLTALAVTAFLDSHFDPDANQRDRARLWLTDTFPAEVQEVSWTPARGY